MSRLVIVRHGATGFNAGAESGERIRGWDSVPLNDLGRREAAEVAGRVARRYKVGLVYTSDLPRAQETAEFIAARSKASIAPSIDLRTMNMGCLTGRLVSEVLAELQYFDAHPDECPKDGETKNHFIGRYARDLDELMLGTRRSKYDAVLVTHSRNVVATPHILTGRSQPHYSAIPTGALMEIKPDGKRHWKIVLFCKSLRAILDTEVELSAF